MSHLAYARKYRPKNFDEIIDQEHIATTLKNAIAQDNIAHAYLFCGPRGIGKTSTARILAKALNCEKGPTKKPCNKCTACSEISESRSLDVLEIDGASNRGIDEIRTLRENVKFAPSSSRYKIYIIDEVHMLTTEAFNALLKTLEEPPAHVKFIFATTEPHKVLPTILSRCQRFDFRKITAEGIINKLKQLIAEEKISCDEEALYAIAKSADGSLRDAEVILDQLNSFSKGKITLEAVSSVLGLVSRQAVFTIVEQLVPEHTADNLNLINDLIQEGKDPAQLANAFIEHFRDMMLVKCKAEKLVTLPQEDKQKIKQQSEKFGLENVLYCIAVLVQAQERIKRQGAGRILLETAVIKLSHQQELLPAKVLLEKVQALEERLKQITPVSGSTSKPSPAFAQAATKTKIIPEGSYSKVSPQDSTNQVQEQASKPEKPVVAVLDHIAVEENTFEEPEVMLESINAIWSELIQQVRKKKMSLGMYLSEGRPLKVHGKTVDIGFLYECEFHRENLAEEHNLQMLESIASSLLNKKIKLNLITCNELPVKFVEEPVIRDEHFIQEIDSGESDDFNAFIQSAMDVFNGRIVQPDE